MAYIHFTDEQKQRANSVDLPDFLKRQGEKLIRSGREWRWERHDSVTVRGNRWFRHSCLEGGYSINFVQEFYGLSFPEAVTLLLGGESGIEWNQAAKGATPFRKEFVLPEANSNMRRVFAYLIKQRFISQGVLSYFAHANLLYEDKEYHNAVFVGVDENGIARHAHKRSTYTHGKPYKGNVEGSDPQYSFHWIGEGDILYVFEAPVDMLSYITLYPTDWKKYSYVTLDGVSEHAMLCQLVLNPHLKKIVLCLDHDAAGIEASGRLEDILLAHSCYQADSMEINILRSEFKDWNEDLRARHGIRPILAQEHPKLELLPQVCSQLVDTCKKNTLGIDSKAILMEQLERLKPMISLEKLNVQNTEAIQEQLGLTAAGILLFIQDLYRQMEEPASLEQVINQIKAEYRPYQDRGWMRTRADDIWTDIREITCWLQSSGIRTMDELKAFRNACQKLIMDCMKTKMFLALESSMHPVLKQTRNFTMTM